ncbi:uncharacterized protein LOC110432337 isoform X3 [Sorghum bicolor]|uniref:uncharacterized protein LOC110432337 isoform X3 n=1 Tax=Sorghum bicolor TaxID=4558 RepID=UPI000B4239E5|nr:uncharacterized protein LOC110432337 isoform X3 [Sorghum bicolor]|eukprot:XP_021308219.1 uncharacterized protein LOC110432337 isoform X3 [Sorghum bicolor]
MMSSMESSSSGDDEAGRQTGSEEVESPIDDEQQQSVPGPVCRPRKPRTPSKWPTDKVVVTEISPDGMPTDVRAQRRLRLLAGLIARQKLSLVMPSFKDLTDENKQKLFDKHVMPHLEFPPEMKSEGFRTIMKVISKSWRTHKNRLVTNFIEKNLSPFKQHPYIEPEDWVEFVALKQSAEAVAASDKYKMLRQNNVHNHRLGTAGYEGKLKQWEAEDVDLSTKGIPNPWDNFPEGRPRQWLRARSKLVRSEDKAEIIWSQDSTKKISEDIKEKQLVAESSGITWVRENDVLTACLGPEQPGRVRGVSGYTGWRHGWPECSSMYRKRKRSDVDVEAITAQVRQEITAQVTEDVTAKVTKEVSAKVTQDIMSYLADQGFHIRPPPSRTPSPACGRRSSCASASNAVANELELENISFDPDTIDLLKQPTQCSLVANLRGYQVVVAEGRVFPQEIELQSVPIDYEHAVVQVENVHPGYEDYVLQSPPDDDTNTLGEALLKRIQWRRLHILVNSTLETQPTLSQPNEITKSAKSASKGTNAIISTKLLSGAKSTSSNHQSPAISSDATKSVSKEPNAANPSKNQKSLESGAVANTQLPTQPKVGTKAVGGSGKPPMQHKGASKADGENVKPPMQQKVSSKAAGESEKAVTHQKLASRAVEESLKPQLQQQKWSSKYKCGQPFLPAMDLKIVGPGCTALHAHYMKDCADNEKSGILVRFKGIYMLNSSDFEVGLVRYNHLYDFFNFGALDCSLLRCLTLAFATHTSKMKDKPKPLTHAAKYACHQQSISGKGSSFYAAHHLILAMRQTNLECPEEFEVLTKPIDVHMIREKLAMFLVTHVINKKGEFYHPN